MIKIADKRTTFWDVDDTLIMWDCSQNGDEEGTIFVAEPDGRGNWFRPHRKHIELLKKLKNIGWQNVVWSQGGSDHAERVIKALEIEGYIDLVVPKPEMYVDDLPFESQYIKRKYLDE